ncbi:MAG: DUF721 domain-containing protein [Bacillota bacterium]|nr:DUF721 domain-containing protein [Bacillota bacterium]MDI7248977.1 DUF721 domain-containing protein [Bacillota bacterium]
MPRRGMEQLGFTLERTLKRLGIARGVRERMALVVWGEVVGPAAARNTRPVLVRRGQLFVQASSSTWAQELSLMRNHLVARLNARLGDEVIRDIRFAVDPALRADPKPGAPPAMGEPAGGGDKGELPGPESRLQTRPEWQEEGRDLEMALGSGAAVRWYRVRRAAAGRREELVRRGWKRCSLCGAWSDPALIPLEQMAGVPFLCAACHHGGAGDRVREAADALGRAPWLSAQELCNKVPGLRPAEARLARHAAAERLRGELKALAATLMDAGPRADWSAWRARAQELVLMGTGLPLASIGEGDMKEVLGELFPVWQASARPAFGRGKH